MNPGSLGSSSYAPPISSSYGVKLVLRAMVMPPRYYATWGRLGSVSCCYCRPSAPATEPLTRILNQTKKRPSPARFGRYLDFIAAHSGPPTDISLSQSEGRRQIDGRFLCNLS